MYPIIFEIGRFELHSYGVMLALAFFSGVILAAKRGKRYGFNFDQIYDVSIIITISALLGSRLAYVLLHLDEFRGRWWDTINPVQSTGQIGIAGMVILGGVVTTVVVTSLYAHWKKLSIPKIVDAFSPSLALGIALGRIGCFLNGCCFGKECHLPWGVSFPAGSIAHYIVGNSPVHPTQIYETLYCLVIFIAILLFEKRKKFFGFNGAVFLTMYGVFRFFNEIFRYYEGSESGMILFRMGEMDITFSQIASLVMFAGGALIIILGNRSVKIAKE